jgi:hypothetical protein
MSGGLNPKTRARSIQHDAQSLSKATPKAHVGTQTALARVSWRLYRAESRQIRSECETLIGIDDALRRIDLASGSGRRGGAN